MDNSYPYIRSKAIIKLQLEELRNEVNAVIKLRIEKSEYSTKIFLVPVELSEMRCCPQSGPNFYMAKSKIYEEMTRELDSYIVSLTYLEVITPDMYEKYDDIRHKYDKKLKRIDFIHHNYNSIDSLDFFDQVIKYFPDRYIECPEWKENLKNFPQFKLVE
jgi:hypothetical protein